MLNVAIQFCLVVMENTLHFSIIIYNIHLCKLQVWGPDLKKLAEVQSNPCSVFCLAGSDSTIYSCSNEGTVKAFELDTLKEKGVIAEDKQTEFWRVSHDNDCLYTGDHVGNVSMFYSCY